MADLRTDQEEESNELMQAVADLKSQMDSINNRLTNSQWFAAAIGIILGVTSIGAAYKSAEDAVKKYADSEGKARVTALCKEAEADQMQLGRILKVARQTEAELSDLTDKIRLDKTDASKILEAMRAGQLSVDAIEVSDSDSGTTYRIDQTFFQRLDQTFQFINVPVQEGASRASVTCKLLGVAPKAKYLPAGSVVGNSTGRAISEIYFTRVTPDEPGSALLIDIKLSEPSKADAIIGVVVSRPRGVEWGNPL